MTARAKNHPAEVHPGFGPDVDCNYGVLLLAGGWRRFIRASARMWIATTLERGLENPTLVHPGFGPDVDCNRGECGCGERCTGFIRASARMWIATSRTPASTASSPRVHPGFDPDVDCNVYGVQQAIGGGVVHPGFGPDVDCNVMMLLTSSARPTRVHPGFSPDVDCNASSNRTTHRLNCGFIRASARMWIATIRAY